MSDKSVKSNISAGEDPLSPRKPLAANLARRRLLQGASGGAAALAALKPIGAAAQTYVLTCQGVSASSRCTLSGVTSAAHSFAVGYSALQAVGKDVSYWKSGLTTSGGTPTNAWPTTGLPKACTPTTQVGTLLTGCNSTYATWTIRKLLCYNATTSASVEADFICAYLSAGKFWSSLGPSLTKTFPYSPQEVLDHWSKSGDTSKRGAARTLYNAIKVP